MYSINIIIFEMTDFAKYIESVKLRQGMKSDRELALKLGVSTTAMYNVTKGSGIPSDEVCVRVAELVGDDPIKVLLLAHACKASEKSRPYWDEVIKTVNNVSKDILC